MRKWHDDLATRQPDQAAKAYRLLRAILTTAVQDDLIAIQPCVIKGAGAENPTERPMLDSEVVVRLLNAFPPRLRAMVLVSGFHTLRTGEVMALQRRDVDLLHGTLRVERQTQEITGQGFTVIPNTKSKAGQRVEPLSPSSIDVLTEHLNLYVGPDPEAWLFTRETGRPLRRQDLSHTMADACATAGVQRYLPSRPDGVRFYDLRHHAGTLLHRNPDIAASDAMKLMGQSSVQAFMRYAARRREAGSLPRRRLPRRHLPEGERCGSVRRRPHPSVGAAVRTWYETF